MQKHRAFAFEMYLKSDKSVIIVQWRLRQRFNIGRNGSVPKRDTINRWIQSYRTTVSASTNAKPRDQPRSVKTLQDSVEMVR